MTDLGEHHATLKLCITSLASMCIHGLNFPTFGPRPAFSEHLTVRAPHSAQPCVSMLDTQNNEDRHHQ